MSAEKIRRQPTVVAERDGEVVGFYSLACADAAWQLDDLWVAPNCMRQGIGRMLMEHALEAATRAGARSLAVDADPNAEPFYLRCGAVRRNVVPAPIAGEPGRVRPQLVFESLRA